MIYQQNWLDLRNWLRERIQASSARVLCPVDNAFVMTTYIEILQRMDKMENKAISESLTEAGY